jgi:hypothetical protein
MSDHATRTETADYTAQAHDYSIRVDATDGALTVTLPAAGSLPGKVFVVKKVDSSANAVTIDADGSEEIDGATTESLASQYDAITVQSNGTSWDILATV